MTTDAAGLKDLFYATVRELASLPKLDPGAVADLLGRRLELAAETETVIEYELVGGPATPLTRATLRAGKAMKRTAFQAGVVPGLTASARGALIHVWKEELFNFQIPDPEDREEIGTLAIRVPVGELRFGFHSPTNFIRRVNLMDYTLLDWTLARPWPRSKIPPPP
jgi:hypothetical protein